MLLHWLELWFKRFKFLPEKVCKFLLKDELQVHIQLDHIELLRIHHRLSGEQKLIHRQVVALPHALSLSEHLNSNEPGTWAAFTKVLSDVLQQPMWLNTKPVFIVANHLARYVLVPWNAQISSAAERKSYLAHCFKTIFGEQLQAWHLALSNAQFEKASIASAIPAALLQAIDAAIASRPALRQKSLAVNAIYPALTVAMNHAFLQLSLLPNKLQANFWFVMLENSRLCIGLMENGDWKLLKNLAREPDVSAQLNALILRDIAQRDIAQREVQLEIVQPETAQMETAQLKTIDHGEFTADQYPIVLHCQTALDTKVLSVAGQKIITIKVAWSNKASEQPARWAAA